MSQHHLHHHHHHLHQSEHTALCCFSGPTGRSGVPPGDLRRAAPQIRFPLGCVDGMHLHAMRDLLLLLQATKGEQEKKGEKRKKKKEDKKKENKRKRREKGPCTCSVSVKTAKRVATRRGQPMSSDDCFNRHGFLYMVRCCVLGRPRTGHTPPALPQRSVYPMLSPAVSSSACSDPLLQLDTIPFFSFSFFLSFFLPVCTVQSELRDVQ
ncbi:hypothetical protein BD289DRAFT_184872 [Coniella lustricola]|uniref:Uncharacterized protein n=1 Tax=Coniella lustricola TaxID=2025994 RepID=A0A2T2ZT56_9PEZI|nr:hypothetical protein BD289DRAFT_184872 [Coniella lustricola]